MGVNFDKVKSKWPLLQDFPRLKLTNCRSFVKSYPSAITFKFSSPTKEEPVTHTGQKFDEDDYRVSRFVDHEKTVNQQWAIDLVAEQPIVVSSERVVFSDGGGPLGHPRVYINLDKPGVHTCGYSGRKFINTKYYNEAEHGKSVTYEAYLEEVNGFSQPKDYPK